jgi:hypothetical protein
VSTHALQRVLCVTRACAKLQRSPCTCMRHCSHRVVCTYVPFMILGHLHVCCHTAIISVPWFTTVTRAVKEPRILSTRTHVRARAWRNAANGHPLRGGNAIFDGKQYHIYVSAMVCTRLPCNAFTHDGAGTLDVLCHWFFLSRDACSLLLSVSRTTPMLLSSIILLRSKSPHFFFFSRVLF